VYFNLPSGLGLSVLCQVEGVGHAFPNHHILKHSGPLPLFFLISPLALSLQAGTCLRSTCVRIGKATFQ